MALGAKQGTGETYAVYFGVAPSTTAEIGRMSYCVGDADSCHSGKWLPTIRQRNTAGTGMFKTDQALAISEDTKLTIRYELDGKSLARTIGFEAG